MNGPPDPPGERASARFAASARQIGFTPPPVAVRVKLLRGGPYGSLFVQPLEPSSMAPLVGWLEPSRPLRIEFGSHHVLRADFVPIPASWATRYRSIDLDMARLHPDGTAIAAISGDRTEVATFARTAALQGLPLDVSGLRASTPGNRLLTPPQDLALRAAAEAGYYRIPRPLTLRDLARRLGVSGASLSERLRRAEARVILRYVNEGARSPWDDLTLYDEHDLAPMTFPDLKAESLAAEDGT